MPHNLSNTCVKSNAHYTCQECGSTELISAHHRIPKDDNSRVVLCANCHSAKHPNVPRSLFFQKNAQPYWENISASSVAKKAHCIPRTIIRRARRLNIPKGILTAEDEAKLLLRPKWTTRVTRPKRLIQHISANVSDEMSERMLILLGNRLMHSPGKKHYFTDILVDALDIGVKVMEASAFSGIQLLVTKEIK